MRSVLTVRPQAGLKSDSSGTGLSPLYERLQGQSLMPLR